jgi:RimJ/RimL family protein N-acetyltransferase
MKWINDPDMRNYLLVRFPISLKDEKEWIANMSAKGLPRNIIFAVELRRGEKHIGSVALHQIDWVQRRATTGSFISPASLRGKGYATEAKELLLGYAFDELGLHSIWSIANANNPASIRALEKQGYKRSGVWRQATLVKGEWVDAVYFDILQDEWAAMRQGARGKTGKTVIIRKAVKKAPKKRRRS